MIVRIRMDVSDDERRAIRKALGRSGLATRAEVTNFVLRLFHTHKPALLRDEPERPTGPVVIMPPDPPRTYTYRAICGERVVSTCGPERDVEAWRERVTSRYQEVA